MIRILILFVFACASILQFSDVSAQADKQLVEMADMTYAYGARQDALDQYLLALKSNPKNDKAAYMAGRLFLQGAEKSNALQYLIKAQNLNPKGYTDILLLIGMSHHAREEFPEAIEFYEKFKGDVLNATYLDDNQKQPILTELERLISMADNAMRLKKTKSNLKVQVLSANINSKYPDYGPALTADGKTMIFTSRRRGGMSGNKDTDNIFYEDIYISHLVDSAWTPARNLGASVNTAYHDASIGMSPDGKTLFLYRDVYRGDIYYSKWQNDSSWSQPKNISRNINSNYKETSASVTEDGSKLFFTSNRPGGAGGFDIYVSESSGRGNWKKPERIGGAINTPYDEESPFITPDGKSLYFSSTGHNGIGGYDIFRSDYDEETKTWSAPENLGYPINSVYDDVFYVQLGDRAYYSSVREDGLGLQDILMVNLNPDTSELATAEDTATTVEVTPDLDTTSVTTSSADLKDVNLTVKIFDENDRPMAASVELTTLNDNRIDKLSSGDKGVYNSKFTDLKPGNVRLSIEQDGYMFYNEDLSFPDSDMESISIVKEVRMKPMRTGMVSVLRNVYFDSDQATLKPASYAELDKVAKVLKENPDVSVVISGHTDEKGTKGYNLSLSERRARAVVKYLTKAGVDASKMEAKGQGETAPIVSNDDEKDGRELNRRTELIVVTDASSGKKGTDK